MNSCVGEGEQSCFSARSLPPVRLPPKIQMEPCGVMLQVRSHSDPEFFELRDKKKVQSWIGRYGCTTGDASDLVEDLLYSQEHEATNTSRYLHPHVDKNALQNPKVDNIEHRREGLQTLMSMLMQDLLIIPLYVEQDSFALHKSYTW